MITQVPLPLTQHISQIIVDVLSHIVFTYVLNQSKGHWLLNDVLNYAIYICLKLKGKKIISISFDSFMEEKPNIVVVELGCFTTRNHDFVKGSISLKCLH
jgi:hypothetical protein